MKILYFGKKIANQGQNFAKYYKIRKTLPKSFKSLPKSGHTAHEEILQDEPGRANLHLNCTR